MKEGKTVRQRKGEEIFFRIIVLIVNWIIFYFWSILIGILLLINLIIVIFTQKTNKDIGDFAQVWVSELTKTVGYVFFVSDEKPFPFSDSGNRNKKG